MPKKVITYYCDKCGQGYDSEKKALDCESKHLSVGNVKPEFDMRDKKNKYPTTLKVTLSDGSIVTYYRSENTMK